MLLRYFLYKTYLYYPIYLPSLHFFSLVLSFSMHPIAITETAPAPITETPIDLAQKCDPAECVLPYCFCSKDGTIIPGGLQAEDVSRHLLKWHPGKIIVNMVAMYDLLSSRSLYAATVVVVVVVCYCCCF